MYIVQLYTAFLIMWGTLVSLKVVSNSINLWRFQWSQWVCFPFGKTRFTLNLFSHSMCYSVVTAVSVETSFVTAAVTERESFTVMRFAGSLSLAESAPSGWKQSLKCWSRLKAWKLEADGCRPWKRWWLRCLLVRTPWTSSTGGPTMAATWGSLSMLAGLDLIGEASGLIKIAYDINLY